MRTGELGHGETGRELSDSNTHLLIDARLQLLDLDLFLQCQMSNAIAFLAKLAPKILAAATNSGGSRRGRVKLGAHV